MTTHVPIAEAKAKLAALVNRAEAGEEIVLTRHGRPAAKLVPARPAAITYGDLAHIPCPDDLSWREDEIQTFYESKLP
jgi:prevent-host-death family protein